MTFIDQIYAMRNVARWRSARFRKNIGKFITQRCQASLRVLPIRLTLGDGICSCQVAGQAGQIAQEPKPAWLPLLPQLLAHRLQSTQLDIIDTFGTHWQSYSINCIFNFIIYELNFLRFPIYFWICALQPLHSQDNTIGQLRYDTKLKLLHDTWQ